MHPEVVTLEPKTVKVFVDEIRAYGKSREQLECKVVAMTGVKSQERSVEPGIFQRCFGGVVLLAMVVI